MPDVVSDSEESNIGEDASIGESASVQQCPDDVRGPMGGTEAGGAVSDTQPEATKHPTGAVSVGDIACSTCKSGENEDDILLCDGLGSDMKHMCEAAQHFQCAGLTKRPAKREQWFCGTCMTRNVEAVKGLNAMLGETGRGRTALMEKWGLVMSEELGYGSGTNKIHRSTMDRWLGCASPSDFTRVAGETTRAMVSLYNEIENKKRTGKRHCVAL